MISGVFVLVLALHSWFFQPGKALARIVHESVSRDQEDGCACPPSRALRRGGRATWQLVPRYRGIGAEAYLNGTSQEPTPEDARKDGHIRGRSK